MRIKSIGENRNDFLEDGMHMGTELADPVKLNNKPAVEKAAEPPGLVSLGSFVKGVQNGRIAWRYF